jgi:hypothetical protein
MFSVTSTKYSGYRLINTGLLYGTYLWTANCIKKGANQSTVVYTLDYEILFSMFTPLDLPISVLPFTGHLYNSIPLQITITVYLFMNNIHYSMQHKQKKYFEFKGPKFMP